MILLVGWTAVGVGQGIPAPRTGDDEVIAIAVLLNVRTLVYTAGSGNDVATVYTASPISFEVVITNNTRKPVSVGVGRPSWLDSLSIRLTCLSCPEPGSPTTLGPESARANRNPDGSLELPAGQNVRVSFALTASALQPGRYELSASVPPAALDPDARRLNNLLMREALFEIRAPRSDLEVVESYLQLSHTLSQQGHHGDARETAERALEIKPNSIVARHAA